jgi:hypothetical protein
MLRVVKITPPSSSSSTTSTITSSLFWRKLDTFAAGSVRFYAVSASAEKQMKQQEELTAQRIRERKLANNKDVHDWMNSTSASGASNFIITKDRLLSRKFVLKNQVRAEV